MAQSPPSHRSSRPRAVSCGVGTRASIEVLVVHRPKYDDWSFPKGKREPVRRMTECALREVEEETGLRCTLGRELAGTSYADRHGRPKTVRYWVMRVESGCVRAEPRGGRDLLAHAEASRSSLELRARRRRPSVVHRAARRRLTASARSRSPNFSSRSSLVHPALPGRQPTFRTVPPDATDPVGPPPKEGFVEEPQEPTHLARCHRGRAVAVHRRLWQLVEEVQQHHGRTAARTTATSAPSGENAALASLNGKLDGGGSSFQDTFEQKASSDFDAAVKAAGGNTTHHVHQVGLVGREEGPGRQVARLRRNRLRDQARGKGFVRKPQDPVLPDRGWSDRTRLQPHRASTSSA